MAVAPEKHNLPYSSAFRPFSPCIYYKTQEKIVSVIIALHSLREIELSETIATLPEGYRPAANTEILAIIKGPNITCSLNVYTSGVIALNVNNTQGNKMPDNDYLFADFSFISN